jgi:hypothetical protein
MLTFNGEANITNNVFLYNKGGYGGAICIESLGIAATLHITNNTFYMNSAQQGGAIHLSVMRILSGIRNNLFINNSAVLFGSTFAGARDKLALISPKATNAVTNNIELVSGDLFPEFSVYVQDTFSQRIVPSDFFVDFLIAFVTVTHQLDSDSPPKASVAVGYEEAMLQDEEAASFNKLQVVGLQGSYALLILPRINFDPAVINARLNFSMKECLSPKILHSFGQEPFPRCVSRKCHMKGVPLLVLITSLSFVWRWLQRPEWGMYRYQHMHLPQGL